MARARARARAWWRLTPLKAFAIVAAGVVSGLLLARLGGKFSGYSYGGNSTPQFDRDPSHLLPSFAQKLELLFTRLRARGYDPYLYEGFKTHADARASSLQPFGAGASVISTSAGTTNPGFFQALGDEAELLDLTWGGQWEGSERDPSYVQAIPRFLASEFRGLETVGARDQFLRETYSA